MDDPIHEPDRRAFTQALALAPLVGLLDLEGVAAFQPAPPAVTPLTAEALNAFHRELGQALEARYGRWLTGEQIKLARRSLLTVLQSTERLRQVPLKNADEPATIFQATPEEE